MNNKTAASTIIQEEYQGYIYSLVLISNITLLFYTSLLSMSREKDYIWKKPFTKTTVLYIFTRYTAMITLVSYFAVEVYPFSIPIRPCDIIFNTTHILALLTYIGNQGLLITRAHALCQACNLGRWCNFMITGTFALSFFGGLFFELFTTIRFGGCSFIDTGDEALFILLGNGCVLLTDVLVFLTCLYYFWDGWRSFRTERNNFALVSLLFRATILRFCFAVVIILTLEIVARITHHPLEIAAFQNSLSALLIAEFTLDIRECDSADGHFDNSIILPEIIFTSNNLSNNASLTIE